MDARPCQWFAAGVACTLVMGLLAGAGSPRRPLTTHTVRAERYEVTRGQTHLDLLTEIEIIRRRAMRAERLAEIATGIAPDSADARLALVALADLRRSHATAADEYAYAVTSRMSPSILATRETAEHLALLHLTEAEVERGLQYGTSLVAADEGNTISRRLFAQHRRWITSDPVRGYRPAHD